MKTSEEIPQKVEQKDKKTENRRKKKKRISGPVQDT